MDILYKILYMLYLCYIPLPNRSNIMEVSAFRSDNLRCYVVIHLVTIIVHIYIHLPTGTHLAKIQKVASKSHVHTPWYISVNMTPLSSFLTAVYLFNLLCAASTSTNDTCGRVYICFSSYQQYTCTRYIANFAHLLTMLFPLQIFWGKMYC